MMRRIAAILGLVLLIGCSRRELSEEEKKEQWDRQAQHQSPDYKPSDGAFGAKDCRTPRLPVITTGEFR